MSDGKWFKSKGNGPKIIGYQSKNFNEGKLEKGVEEYTGPVAVTNENKEVKSKEKDKTKNR